MRFLVLYNKKPQISEWADARFDFDLKKTSFKNAPRYIQSDGDDVIDAKWLVAKCDTTKYDGVIAYVKGNVLHGVWGTHVKFQLGDKRFSVIQAEHHDDLYRKPKGVPGFIKMVSTKEETPYPQAEYTFNHELVHAYKYLKGENDLLHTYIKFGKYDEYLASIPEKKTNDLPFIVDKIADLSSYNLQPRVERNIKKVLYAMAIDGKPMYVVEGFRSLERQNELYKRIPKVTNAKAGESFHNYGVAVDCAFIKYGYNAPRSWWKKYGEMAKLNDFDWGGDWKSFVDKPHVEMTLGYSIDDFKKGLIDDDRFL